MTSLRDMNVSAVERERGWLGMGRDHAEDDPSWDTFRLKPLVWPEESAEREERAA